MNAQSSRIESDYAADLRQVFLAKIQTREIRRRQFKHLGAMAFAWLAYLLVLSIAVWVVVMIGVRL